MKEKQTIIWATIIKNQTEDGLITVDEKYIGERVPIILETIRHGIGFNKQKEKRWMRKIVNKEQGGWLPVEILQIDE